MWQIRLCGDVIFIPSHIFVDWLYVSHCFPWYIWCALNFRMSFLVVHTVLTMMPTIIGDIVGSSVHYWRIINFFLHKIIYVEARINFSIQEGITSLEISHNALFYHVFAFVWNKFWISWIVRTFLLTVYFQRFYFWSLC